MKKPKTTKTQQSTSRPTTTIERGRTLTANELPLIVGGGGQKQFIPANF